MPGMGNPARRAPVATRLGADEDRAAFFANIDLQNDLREVYDAANRNNTAIYTLDPRGLATGEFDIIEGVGRRPTGSTCSRRSTRCARWRTRPTAARSSTATTSRPGLKQVVQDSSAYYLIGYNSTNRRADGKFHEIKVRAKRPGVQVRARRGYWALTKEEAARARGAAAAGRAGRGDQGARLDGRAVAGALRPELDRHRRGREREDARDLRVGAAACRARRPSAAPAGRQSCIQVSAGSRSFCQGAVKARRGARRSAPATVTFDADPGAHAAAHLGGVREAGTRSTSRCATSGCRISRAARSRLSTPAVFRSGNAREFQALVANPAPVPTASREFRRTERLLVRFDAYAPGTEVPVVTARVLNRAGNRMADLEVRAPQPPATLLPAGSAAGRLRRRAST